MNDQSEPSHAAMTDENDEQTLNAPPSLSDIEIRVLGALMEKQLTTPDQYPLTVNSLVNACNQKSNREPVSNYEQGSIVRTLQALEDKKFVRREFGSRTDKYSQCFTRELEVGNTHQAVLCMLMLRGPQSIGELSTRTQRMDVFEDREALMHCIERLCNRDTPYAASLGQQPGQRGERFTHLFGDTPADIAERSSVDLYRSAPKSEGNVSPDSLTALQHEITELNQTVAKLQADNDSIKAQLEKLYELTGYSLQDNQP